MRVGLIALSMVAIALALPSSSDASTGGGPTGTALAKAAAAMPKPLLGGASLNPTWYAANVGPVQIYRMYDIGFTWPTWQETLAYQLHGNAQEDYSFNLPPADVAAGLDDAMLITFIASTPRNIILTNYHEPEQEIEAGSFTAAEFRASIVRLSVLVRAQNAIDGGTRRTSVILMYGDTYGFKNRHAIDYWPGRDPATGVNYADLISFDTYALPHATETPGVPRGFTDGLKWQTAKVLLDPSIAFATSVGSPWMVSEFGFLEDINKPMRKAQAITDFVNYARLHGAVTVEYWDSAGTRADWQLRYRANATNAWKTIVNAP